MKKWFTFLLLLLTMAGSFYPCCMEDDCADETALQQENRSHQSHQDKGPCSPFFACGNCAAAIALSNTGVGLTEAQPAIVEHQSAYLLRLGSYTSSLFQPPRCS